MFPLEDFIIAPGKKTEAIKVKQTFSNLCLTGRLEQNNVDPDQKMQNVASDQGLHCLPSSSF